MPPWSQHPTLKSLQPSIQITADCWALLAARDGSSRKEHYLHKGEREKKDGKMVLKPGEVDSNYWSVVNKWVKQVGEGDIEEEE